MKEYSIHFEERLGKREIYNSRKGIKMPELLVTEDNEINENRSFDYIVALPDKLNQQEKHKSAILLFHGLNERSWDKYRPWADFLSEQTSTPVILFPIALHINRSPKLWSNPREMQRLISIENQKNEEEIGRNENLSFANYALSSRIKADPFRFYLSGRETIMNVCQLMDEIREGSNKMFSKECKVDIFAYSIGALLSQVLLMANPKSHFSQSRLFMFCGGSFFVDMNGNSKLIMDKNSFDLLHSYYRGVFITEGAESRRVGDYLERAFVSHIDPSFYKKERKSFYLQSKERIRAISLKKDKVIPTFSIKKALGSIWKDSLKEFDFPFEYSHEIPFPAVCGQKISLEERDFWFKKVFLEASQFLKKQ